LTKKNGTFSLNTTDSVH